MSLTFKEQELAAVGASVAAGCKPCTTYHTRKARESGAADDEIKESIYFAIDVRDSAKGIMENHALWLLGLAGHTSIPKASENTVRIRELVSIAAAFAVNCTSSLNKHIATARTIDITDKEIESVLSMAKFIKGMAASHVDKIAKEIEGSSFKQEKTNTIGCGCANVNVSGNGANESTKQIATKDEESCDCG